MGCVADGAVWRGGVEDVVSTHREGTVMRGWGEGVWSRSWTHPLVY